MQAGRVIAFASRALTDTEKRYTNIDREILVVVAACEKFHSYVIGKKFTVESDHKPLEMTHLNNLTAAPPRLQRMLLRIQRYDLTIKYKPGTEMLLADSMSRLNPLPKCTWCNALMQDCTPSGRTLHEIPNFQPFEKPFTLDGLKN